MPISAVRLLTVLALACLMLACSSTARVTAPPPPGDLEAAPPLTPPPPLPPPAVQAQAIDVEQLQCIPTGGNALVKAIATNEPGGVSPRLYFRWRDHGEPYWVELEPAGSGRYWGVFPRPEPDNEEVEYHAALVDGTGEVVAKSAVRTARVVGNCPVRLGEREEGVAGTLTVGETVAQQQGEPVLGFLCDGIFTRVNHQGIRRTDEFCGACAVSWNQPPPPPPTVGSEEEDYEDEAMALPGDDARDARAAREPAPPLVDKKLRFVRLFYGTNRARTEPCAGLARTRWDDRGVCLPNAYYEGFPADIRDDGREGLEVGTLTVTFPPGHRTGNIERPFQVFTFTFRDEDPALDVVISELQSFADQAWARELKETGRDQAFIYVHGFNTTFAEAARQAAQLAYDLDFDLEADFRGVPMLFSWPSRGTLDAYVLDTDIAEISAEAFNHFLKLVKMDAGISRVHVIAHSMGNRVVTDALHDARDRHPAPPIDQLILAAPDVAARLFKVRFLHTLPELASRVTLYVSDHDLALNVSSDIRKGEPRAGQVAGGLLEASRGVEGFDAINASILKSDFLGHGYYANDRSMLGDIYCLLRGTPAEDRPLLAVAGTAWQFRPPQELATLDPVPCAAAVAAATPGAPDAPDAGPPPPAIPGRLIAAAVVVVAPLLGSIFWWWWRRRHP